MDTVNFILDMTRFAIEEKILEKGNYEIMADNFILDAEKKSILTLKPDCKIEKPGWFGNNSYTIDDKFNKDAYLELYLYLAVKKIIIKKETNTWTWDYVYTVNKESIETNKLQDLIKKENNDFPNVLKCYEINYEELSNLLQKYTVTKDENNKPKQGGKKKNKTNKRKNKKYTSTKK